MGSLHGDAGDRVGSLPERLLGVDSGLSAFGQIGTEADAVPSAVSDPRLLQIRPIETNGVFSV